MPLNSKGRQLIKVLTQQHGLKFHGLSQSGVLHYSLTDKARVQAFKSTLRKYRLHYRAEDTQQAQETGIYTLKIHTERDHQIAKLRRKKEKLRKQKSTGKDGKGGGGHPRFLSLIAGLVEAKHEETEIRKELSLSIVDWEALQKANFSQYLTLYMPSILDLRALVDEVQWFFDKLHEHELSTKFDHCIEQIDSILQIISGRLEAEDTLDRLKNDITNVSADMSASYADLQQLCSSTVNKIVEVSSRPKQAFASELSPYWSVLSDVWNAYREVLYPKWDTYADELTKQLRVAKTDISISKEAAVNRLVTVQQLLRKHMHYRDADEVGNLLLLAKEESLAQGQVPALTTTNGGHMVYVDDCPDPAKPAKYTNVTDKFAFCKTREDGTKCPSFLGVHGESVLCASAGVNKQAGSFFSMISELTDKELLDQLQKIAHEDNNLLSLFHLAEARDNKLYYGRISDDRIGVILEHYPSSKRVGTHSYSVYYIAGEPIFVTNEIAVCADSSLLSDLDSGTPMPRIATVRNAAVMRMTFTSNARMDPNFLDYMRKLNARKVSENTWDVPYRMEAEKPRLLAEIVNDFGYPLQLFQLVESPAIANPRIYEVCAMTLVSRAQFVPEFDSTLSVPRLRASDRLYDIAAQASKDSAGKLEALASTLRVSSNYIVARKDEIVSEQGYIGVNYYDGVRIFATDGSVVEYDNGIFRNTVTGAESSSKPAAPKVEAHDGGECITIRISPDALNSVLHLIYPGSSDVLKNPVPPPTRDVLNDPVPPPTGDVLKDPAEGGTFVTFTPQDGSSGRKIKFLTPEVQAERSRQ